MKNILLLLVLLFLTKMAYCQDSDDCNAPRGYNCEEHGLLMRSQIVGTCAEDLMPIYTGSIQQRDYLPQGTICTVKIHVIDKKHRPRKNLVFHLFSTHAYPLHPSSTKVSRFGITNKNGIVVLNFRWDNYFCNYEISSRFSIHSIDTFKARYCDLGV